LTKVDELNNWRRTHYSSDICSDLNGFEITTFGRVASIRKQGEIIFIILQDKSGILQITVKKNKSPKSVLNKIKDLSEHSILGVRGILKSIDKAPHGAEVIPSEIKILDFVKQSLPFNPYKRELPSLDKRLDVRALDLRRPKAQAIFRIRDAVLWSIREFLIKKSYLEVNTPKIIATATEGGAALFPLLYYNREAFLAQSPQLYKEQLVSCFEKVFEIAPIFRAEQFDTLKHLSEAISVDIEEAFVNYEDSMKLLEQLICNSIKFVNKKCKKDLEILNHEIRNPETPFKQFTYDEIITILKNEGLQIEWGEDLSTLSLKAYSKKISGFYFIKDWPTSIKAFYINPKKDTPEICESFDLMYGSLEISSGGTRVNVRKVLEKQLEIKGLDPERFEYHLKIFDYGMPPHSGFGMGLDRLVLILTGLENIREVVLFPRDPSRLTP
jgi:nondiscriminating aspartyl-tRNA synthetase